MRVEVLVAYGPYSRGTVIPDMPGNVARSMIGRGMIREVPNEDSPIGAKQYEAPANRMISAAPANRGVKRRGR